MAQSFTKNSKRIKSVLVIRGLELHVNLGWPEKERRQEQVVRLDVEICFPKIPKGCVSDHLDDTICYADLIEHLRTHIATRHFHLIEHLSYTLYHLLKKALPKTSSVRVRITKHPEIQGLNDGVSFEYGDD